MAVEDGAILGLLLAKLQNRMMSSTQSEKSGHLTRLFQLYQDLRKKRTEVNVAGAIHTRHYYHLPDGDEQKQRDKELATLAEYKWKGSCQFNWGDAQYQESLLGFDVLTDAEKKFDQWWACSDT